MNRLPFWTILTLSYVLLLPITTPQGQAQVRGWLDWRGPEQTGVSRETGLPDKWKVNGANHLWSIKIAGGGSPVIANGKLFALGYRGQGPDLQEVLFCADAETGKVVWERTFSDFLSDISYDRYAIGGPTVDAETGNVYVVSAAGIFSCFTPAGKLVWQHSMMEKLGRLTFVNGRSGAPFIDHDLVYTRYITSNWGADGPAMDRFYAFDKKTGLLVWSGGSGAAPKDNSFARPYFVWENGKRLFYTGCGDGSVIAMNARTGEVLWKINQSAGGFNASVVLHKNMVIATHADENLDSSEIGRLMAIRIDAPRKPQETGPPLLDPSAVVWKASIASISSSPVIVGSTIYQVNKTGELIALNADTGKIAWKKALALNQLHASPTYADGKLYLPLEEGHFFIVRPTPTEAVVLEDVKLPGRCIGTPAIWNGKVYVFTTEGLYCFGKKGNNPGLPKPMAAKPMPKPGATVALQITPSEVLLRPGEKASFRIRGIDANGLPTKEFKPTEAQWASYIPPTARVRSTMNGAFNTAGELMTPADAKPSAGAFQATIGEFKGVIRGRVISALPYKEDFESFQINEESTVEPGQKFAYPPLPWIGARFKFDIRELEGNKVFAKTLDNTFFQRATVFLGHPDESNYTLEADVRSDGSRRTMSTVGLINQRYYIILSGNAQELEVFSNQERIKVAVPFKWQTGIWYRLKTRVDVAADGSGVVRAKAWKKEESEPANWMIEVPHKNAHKKGAPGLFGFSPQSLFRVYIDNISITPNN